MIALFTKASTAMKPPKLHRLIAAAALVISGAAFADPLVVVSSGGFAAAYKQLVV
jgi:hypothetical protein